MVSLAVGCSWRAVFWRSRETTVNHVEGEANIHSPFHISSLNALFLSLSVPLCVSQCAFPPLQPLACAGLMPGGAVWDVKTDQTKIQFLFSLLPVPSLGFRACFPRTTGSLTCPSGTSRQFKYGHQDLGLEPVAGALSALGPSHGRWPWPWPTAMSWAHVSHEAGAWQGDLFCFPGEFWGEVPWDWNI